MVSLGAHTRHKWNPNAKSTAITLLSLIAHSTKPWLMSFSKDEGRFLHFSVDKLWQNNLIYCNWYTLLLRLCSLLYVCFCEEFCFFVFNSLMRISTNLLHKQIFFLPLHHCSHIYLLLTKLGRGPIFDHNNFFANVFISITIWSRITYFSALQSLSQLQKVFLAALTLFQKALKVSFLTWTNCLNLKFHIKEFLVGL